jgi:hypothetical protein
MADKMVAVAWVVNSRCLIGPLWGLRWSRSRKRTARALIAFASLSAAHLTSIAEKPKGRAPAKSDATALAASEAGRTTGGRGRGCWRLIRWARLPGIAFLSVPCFCRTNIDMAPLQCQGYGCTSTDLINAHLTPQSFARWIQGTSGPNILISKRRFSKALPHGLYDPNILCGPCDGFLNKRYDERGFEVLKELNGKLHGKTGTAFCIPSVDCDLLCGFVLSILWRYSISTLRDTSEINLGVYQDMAREVLWGLKPLTSFPEFQVFCQRYNPGPVDTEKMYSSPADMRGLEFRSWGCSIIGFHFLSKVDSRPFTDVYGPYILNGRDSLTGCFVDFHATPQGRGAVEMAARLHRRPKRR